MRQITLLLTLLFSLVCGGIHAQKTDKPMKVLVAYYSYSGNTRTVAQQIQHATNGDIFEIEVVTPYPSDYQGLLDQAKKEINNNEKPALKAMPENLAQYDVILVGSPNWWSTIAPPVATFLANANLTGKTVGIFVTHGGGGMARCETDAKKLYPQARTLKGLAVNGSSAKDATSRVEKWLKDIGIVE